MVHEHVTGTRLSMADQSSPQQPKQQKQKQESRFDQAATAAAQTPTKSKPGRLQVSFWRSVLRDQQQGAISELPIGAFRLLLQYMNTH